MATVVGGFATALTTLFAGGALLLAKRQIDANHRISSEQDAQATYSDYLKLCFENPELACSDLAIKTLPTKSFEGLGSITTKESERYIWFLSMMLSANEKIYFSCPNDAAWLRCIKSQIGYHWESLKEVWPNMKGHFSPGFCAIVEDVLEDA
jgi:hypothetical protein